jgi:cytochrome c-type biogenesis protein CcmH/NrfF
MFRALWLIPITLVVVGAGLALRARHRRQSPGAFLPEHVSGDWLAHARGHEEQEW